MGVRFPKKPPVDVSNIEKLLQLASAKMHSVQTRVSPPRFKNLSYRLSSAHQARLSWLRTISRPCDPASVFVRMYGYSWGTRKRGGIMILIP